MCSVAGCIPGPRSVECFKLPDDPERRHAWALFLFEVNGNRLKGLNWTDINICGEHFTEDCFINPTPETGKMQLKAGAIPSVRVKPQCVTHLSILTKEGSLEWKYVSLTEFGCPLCPKFITRIQTVIQRHLKNHTENAVHFQEKKICRCNLSCRERGHFHCPFCAGTIIQKLNMIAHLIECEKKIDVVQSTSKPSSSETRQTPTDQEDFTASPSLSPPPPSTSNSCPTPQSALILDHSYSLTASPKNPTDFGLPSSHVKCPHCSMVLYRQNLLLHIQRKHVQQEETKCKEMAEDEQDQSQDEDGGGFDPQRGLKIEELCTECGSFYSNKSHKCQHKKKPFVCSLCGTRCVSEISLKNHSKIHNENYDYSCKYCHATFRQKGNKLEHEQTHQGSENPYKCPDCPMMFASCKERQAHMSKHRFREEVECEVCGRKFKGLLHLRRHSVVHTGLKLYKCTVCQRDFNQQSNLKPHMRVHTGEKPFQCQHCSKCFKHNMSLKYHIQRFHTKKAEIDQNKGKRQKLDNYSGGGNTKDEDS